MKTKLVYVFAAVLAFASAGATTGHSRPTIRTVLEQQENGDYRLFIFGSDHVLVCEEKPVTVVEQGDAIDPIVVECKH